LRRLSKRAMGIALAACAAGSALVAVQPSPAAAGPQTVISLTFDDGLKNQYTNIAPVLKAAGVKATFYIVSGRVKDNSETQMSWADIGELAKQGHEIGGHTFGHVALTTQTPQQQEDAIKQDVESLKAKGFEPKTFAYPKGDYSPTSIDLVKKYGYTTARRVGPITLTSDLKAETIPPANAFEVRAPASFKRTVTLDDMKGYVTRAEAVGGWLPLIFHDICNGDCPQTETYDYGLPKNLVAEFITWLKAREGQGTVIKTMSSVLENNLNADLGVRLTGPPNAKAGAAVAYDAVSTNNGPSTGENVTTKITVPVTGAVAPQGCQVVQAAATATATCNYGVLGAGQSKTSRITGKLAGAPDTMVNALANVKSTTPDKNPVNNNAEILTGVAAKNAPKADFAVALSSPKIWKRGRTYSIKVTLKNYGPSTAKYVVVDAKLSPGLTIVNKPGCRKVSKTTLHCASRAFLPGRKFVFSVKVRVSRSKALKKVGFWVIGTSTTYDPKLRNNKATFVRVLKK